MPFLLIVKRAYISYFVWNLVKILVKIDEILKILQILLLLTESRILLIMSNTGLRLAGSTLLGTRGLGVICRTGGGVRSL